MDHIDRTLVALLQENARLPLSSLAKQVFLSSPAVSARLERLERSGIIRGYAAQTDPLKLGYPITAFISLDLKPVQKPEFYPYIERVENILEVYCITGKYSILMKAAFPGMAQLDAFLGELSRFGNTQTQIVFSSPVPPRPIRPLKKE